jgi:hypothetical protein
MRWLWLVLSVVCLAIAFRTLSVGLAVVCLVAGLGFMLAFALVLASSRIESRGRDASVMMGPEELRKMRENLERKKAEDAAARSSATSPDADPMDESTPLDDGRA